MGKVSLCNISHINGVGTYAWSNGDKYIGGMAEGNISGFVIIFCQGRDKYFYREFMIGLMEGDMKENGWRIRCTGKEYLNGQMAESMKGHILMIKSMGMALGLGLMVENIKVFGLRENNMAKENITILMGQWKLVSGKMEEEANGSNRWRVGREGQENWSLISDLYCLFCVNSVNTTRFIVIMLWAYIFTSSDKINVSRINWIMKFNSHSHRKRIFWKIKTNFFFFHQILDLILTFKSSKNSTKHLENSESFIDDWIWSRSLCSYWKILFWFHFFSLEF